MDAAERARKISNCAQGIEHCQGLGSIYGIAEFHIRQAEQAARQDERRKIADCIEQQGQEIRSCSIDSSIISASAALCDDLAGMIRRDTLAEEVTP